MIYNTEFYAFRFKRLKLCERFKSRQENLKAAKKKLRQSLFGTGEEQQTACLTAFDALSKTLRSLSDGKSDNALPLRITSVQVCGFLPGSVIYTMYVMYVCYV